MDKLKIERINFLARKAKERPLTDEEKAEQTALRDEYRAEFRNNFAGIIKNVHMTEEEK